MAEIYTEIQTINNKTICDKTARELISNFLDEINNKSNKTDLDALSKTVENKADKIHEHDQYVTNEALNLKNYATESYVDTAIDETKINLENGAGDKSIRSLGTDSDNKKVRKISFYHNGTGYTIYTVNPDFIIYTNNGVIEKKYSSNKIFTLADGSTQVSYSSSDGVVTVTLGGNDITSECTITMGDNNITGVGAIGVGRVLTVGGRAAQGFGGYNEVNGEYSAAFGYNGKNYSKQSIASGNAFCVTSKYASSGNIWAPAPNYTEAESGTNLVTGSQLVVGGKSNLVAGRGVIQITDGSFDKVVESIVDTTTGNITGYKLRTTNVKNLLETDSTIQGTISGDYNIIAGNGHISLGNSNAVFGSGAKILGNYNTVSGWDNKAFGASNTVLGEHNRVTGQNITAIGNHLAVSESYNGDTLKPKGTTVVGQYNKSYSNNEESPVFAVGNGTAEDARSNAMEIWSDGRAQLFQKEVNGVFIEKGDNDLLTKKEIEDTINDQVAQIDLTNYTTKDYVNNAINNSKINLYTFDSEFFSSLY